MLRTQLVGQTSFSAYETSLLHILKVPMDHTRTTGAKSLQEQFLCYLAVTKALNDMCQIKQWPEKPPTERQVTELFIGRSQWSNVWRPTFSRVSQHFPEMVKWLQHDADSKDTEELWGIEAKYTLKMLKEWMDQGGKPLKGKAKIVEEPVPESSLKGLGKEKEKKKKTKQEEEKEKEKEKSVE